MKTVEKLYEGKAKIIYSTDDPNQVIQYFKDDATAFNGAKKGIILSKGVLNNRISGEIFSYLAKKGIPTHFVKTLSDREMLVKKLQIIPVEVVIRNVVAGSLAKRMGKEEGAPLSQAIIEFYYKDDALNDPMINEYHIQAFGLAEQTHIDQIKQLAMKINDLLVPYFDERGIRLIDYKLEFGIQDGQVILGDEITPDACRLWDKGTNEKMDKDRFRFDMGNVEEAYKEIHRRICGN